MDNKQEKIREEIKNLAAEFLSLESNRTSLLTVTNVRLSSDGKYAAILFTVFPENKEKGALEFANRKREEFKDYIKEKSRIGRIPQFSFEVDFGEKNRQKIDDLSNTA
ncbi:MAG TPA: ribosome-binding factor A [Candidatus Paceibacterota bacterium]